MIHKFKKCIYKFYIKWLSISIKDANSTEKIFIYPDSNIILYQMYFLKVYMYKLILKWLLIF